MVNLAAPRNLNFAQAAVCLALCCACMDLDLSQKRSCQSDKDCQINYRCNADLVCEPTDSVPRSDAGIDVDARVNPQLLITSMIFSDDEQSIQRELQEFTSCVAALQTSPIGVLRYGMETGVYVVAVYVPFATQPGQETLSVAGTSFFVHVQDTSLPSTFQTDYGGGLWQAGTVDYSQAEVEPGGVVAATADVKLLGNNGAVSVAMQLSFRGQFPE